MAWEWSHTIEAYVNAKHNLEDLDDETLHTVAVEWFAHGMNSNPDDHVFCCAEKSLAKVPNLDLAYFIWEKTEELATCDNGGFNAWICPFGCHTVFFDRS